MGVGALDTWMHWTIARTDLKALSRAMRNLEVPFGTLVEMAEISVDSRRRGVLDRPLVRARNALQERLLKMTFQSAREWDRGFELIGVRSGLSKVGAAMTPAETRTDVEKRLNSLSHRRNQISHEGDLSRKLRPQSITRNAIARTDVAADLGWIRAFLTAADTVV